MSNTNHNQPAFPWCGDLNECPTINLGISIRDYFAAKAMQAIFSTVPHLAAVDHKVAAEESYEIADAMLKAREA